MNLQSTLEAREPAVHQFAITSILKLHQREVTSIDRDMLNEVLASGQHQKPQRS